MGAFLFLGVSSFLEWCRGILLTPEGGNHERIRTANRHTVLHHYSLGNSKLLQSNHQKHGQSKEPEVNILQYIHATNDVFDRVRSRIGTIGETQYSLGDRQKFEDKTYEEIITDAQEEIEDLIAYASQLHIRLEEVRRVLLMRRQQ